jgi:hypothetical protein
MPNSQQSMRQLRRVPAIRKSSNPVAIRFRKLLEFAKKSLSPYLIHACRVPRRVHDGASLLTLSFPVLLSYCFGVLREPEMRNPSP